MKYSLKYLNIFLLIIISFSFNDFNLFAQQKIDWNGYVQFRFSDNYLDQTYFSFRRTKLWINGTIPFDNDQWSYKIQAGFSNQTKFAFSLQDAILYYKISNIEFSAGQFVPNFSLQRKQSDYLIPLNEKAQVVNSLVPTAETIARDIGLEFKLGNEEKGLFSIGFYNGNGANTISNKRNFLFISRGNLFVLDEQTSKFKIGYSISYRNAHDFSFSKILGNDIFFTGKDFRFGFEGNLKINNFELQSEYIQANLGADKAFGYYAIIDYLLSAKHLLTFSFDKYKDLNPSTNDNPWYIIGYSYLIKGNDIKLTLDNKFQFTSDKTNLLTILQIQYFFNQKME